MITQKFPFSVRQGSSKFTLMKKNPKHFHLQFFKQNINTTCQSDFDKTKIRQSENQAQSNNQNDKVIMKVSFNKSKKEIEELTPPLNPKLIMLFKTLDLVKKKKLSSTNRTTYEKPQETKHQVCSNNDNSNNFNLKGLITVGATRSTNKNKIITKTNLKKNKTKNNDYNNKQKLLASILNNNKPLEKGKKEKERKFNQKEIKKPIKDKLKIKILSKSKEQTIKTFNPFHIDYIKTTKLNQSLKPSIKLNKMKTNTNQLLYLSTNQTNIHNQHNSKTIEQLYSLCPINKAKLGTKWVDTGKDYEAKNEENNYTSNSNRIICDDTDNKQEDSGVLAYEDVKDIIKYNSFDEFAQSKSNLFDSITFEKFIKGYQEKLVSRFFDDYNSKNIRKEHKSLSTNESSHNKRNYFNIIKYSV